MIAILRIFSVGNTGLGGQTTLAVITWPSGELIEKVSPLSDRMEIDAYRTINEIKKALPRELAQDDDIFDIKLLTKSLLVQKFYESEADSFKPISTSRDESGKDAQQHEGIFWINFYPSGMCDDFSITLADDQNKTVTVSVDPLSAKAKVEYGR